MSDYKCGHLATDLNEWQYVEIPLLGSCCF